MIVYLVIGLIAGLASAIAVLSWGFGWIVALAAYSLGGALAVGLMSFVMRLKPPEPKSEEADSAVESERVLQKR